MLFFIICIVIIFIIIYQKKVDEYLINVFHIIRNKLKLNSYEDDFHNSKKKSFNIKDYIKISVCTIDKKGYKRFIKNLFNDHNKIIFEKYKNYMIHKKKKNQFRYCIYANHSKISGRELFDIFLSIFKNDPYKYLTTSILKGIVYIPFFLYNIYNLKEVNIKRQKKCKRIFKKKTIYNVKDKRYIVLLNVMQDMYKMLKLKGDDVMNVMLTASFNEDKYIKNNVGVIIIQYTQKDTILSIKQKLKDKYYQFYASNTLIHIPIKFKGYDIRKYVHCIITSGYIKTNEAFDMHWYAGVTPTEPIYCGIMSQITDKEVILHKSYTTNIAD